MVKLGLFTQNVRGAGADGLFAKLLYEFSRWNLSHGIHVLCVQEHNLHPNMHDDLERMATSRHVTLIISYAPENNMRQHPGGVLILMDNRTLTLDSVTHKTDGFIMIKAEWGGQEIEI